MELEIVILNKISLAQKAKWFHSSVETRPKMMMIIIIIKIIGHDYKKGTGKQGGRGQGERWPKQCLHI
jgi:hypothetical protein